MGRGLSENQKVVKKLILKKVQLSRLRPSRHFLTWSTSS